MDTALRIVADLQEAGYEAYIVGGAVRDLLIGREPHDVDVATSALPEQVKSVFSRTVDTGIAHGTVLVLQGDEGIEVTTFRTEGTYTDNRRPDRVEFVRSLHEDLKRRDFTINAMAMNGEFETIDPFGGREDLEKGRIRAVGDSEERFAEDALRMLRAIRFSGQLGFAIEEETFRAIQNHAPTISSVSVERIKAELDKVFVQEQAERSLTYLVSSGLAMELPNGGLFDIDWSGFAPLPTPLYGWAYLLHANGASATVLRPYKLSNDEKRNLEKTLAAARIPAWNAWVFYAYSALQLQMAALLTGTTVDIDEMKHKLPIQRKQDMAAGGKDLMDWTGEKQGPWLKEWIARIERCIVFGELPNDKRAIEAWFLSEYEKENANI